MQLVSGKGDVRPPVGYEQGRMDEAVDYFWFFKTAGWDKRMVDRQPYLYLRRLRMVGAAVERVRETNERTGAQPSGAEG